MWRLGGIGLILDAEYGCCKKISAVYGFCIVTRLRKTGIQTNGFTVFAFFVELSTRKPLLSIRPSHSCNRTFIANCRFKQITLAFLLHLQIDRTE